MRIRIQGSACRDVSRYRLTRRQFRFVDFFSPALLLLPVASRRRRRILFLLLLEFLRFPFGFVLLVIYDRVLCAAAFVESCLFSLLASGGEEEEAEQRVYIYICILCNLHCCNRWANFADVTTSFIRYSLLYILLSDSCFFFGCHRLCQRRCVCQGRQKCIYICIYT